MEMKELLKRCKLIERTCDGEPIEAVTLRQISQLVLDSAAEVRVHTNEYLRLSSQLDDVESQAAAQSAHRAAKRALGRIVCMGCETLELLGVDNLDDFFDWSLPTEDGE